MGHLNELVRLWGDFEPYKALLGALKKGQSAQVYGLSGAIPVYVSAALAVDIERPVLVLTAGFQDARRFEMEIAQYLSQRPVHLLPPRPLIRGDVTAESPEWSLRRTQALMATQQDPATILVVPVAAARQLILRNRRADLRLAVGQTIAIPEVVAVFEQLGYTRVSEVEQEGQYAVRGGIADVYPPGSEALRIEWFGDEIDSLRAFDPETQRTEAMRQKITISQARETIWSEEQLRRAIDRIAAESNQLIKNLESMGQKDAAVRAQERFGHYLHDLTEGRGFPGVDRFAAAFGPLGPLTEMFPTPPLLIYHDWPRILEAWAGSDKDDIDDQQRRLERGDLIPVELEATLTQEAFQSRFKGHGDVSLSLLPHTRKSAQVNMVLTGRPAPRVHGQVEVLRSEMQRLTRSRLRVALVLRDSGAARAMQQQLGEQGLPSRMGLGTVGEIGIVEGFVGHGFVLPELGLVLLGETELTGREIHPQGSRKNVHRTGVRVQDLRPGDFVVHITHGVGRYVGIKTLEIQSQHQDYLQVQYAGDDVLYVPVNQLGLVQKYVGIEGQAPKLSRMGGAEWNRVKEKVKASVREMAEELVKLYALREARPGHMFGPDTPWQADFEMAFGYEETPDQLRSIREIKSDMERGRPMDRLLCGDVGYGKTEVALRAAFKAIMAGKQVAFLVPTTLLAEQHYQTAKTRLAGYPIAVEALSRFRTPKQQKAIIEDTKHGKVDLLIGTHRLLGKDVKFFDLGLLIIDEEHRFGVAHKERIKSLKETVDVLTLSATPIPRTLHMAMVGIRDMSLIETPPEDRLPVETVVAEFDEDLVRQAIFREIDRGGQVFYVQNRIMAMDAAVMRLLKLFPEIRVAVVHGQMEEQHIEDVMARFIDQEYDVLVATSIIESGLDIPNANTIIVEDADRLGLAQLYQLRGRVGRSSRLAYAYFTFRRDKVLTPAAEKRLDAIREFTELGAGYQLALRDLEIRGAGNLLGVEQHGFIASVGFDLYTELLGQAIRELKGETIEVPVDPSIEIELDAYLPDTYIPDARHKISLYKRLVSAKNLDEVEELTDEMADRFGPMPVEVVALSNLAKVRTLAKELKLTAVIHKRDRVIFRSAADSLVGAETISQLAQKFPGRLLPGIGKAPELGIKLPPRATSDQALNLMLDGLAIMREATVGVQEKSG
ncbi:MAG: transcription-repair coupling factor [Firmicutes bacterium]|nr:transcription-repair coupling factor [Bacillota bacterium]